MQINKIHLKNFRNHLDTTIEFGANNLIVGPNGAGKSSVLDALSFVFTGLCRGTDKGGRGTTRLITIGYEKEGFALDVGTDLGSFQRAHDQGPGSVVGKAITEAVRSRSDVLLALFHPGAFLDLPPADQAALFAALAAPEDISETCKEVLAGSLAASSMPKTMEELDALYERLLNNRKLSKAKVKEFRVTPQIPEKELPADLRGMTPGDIKTSKALSQKQMDELKVKRDNLLRATSPEPEKPAESVTEEYERERRCVENAAETDCPLCQKKLYIVHRPGTSPVLLSKGQREESIKVLGEMIGREKKKGDPAEPPVENEQLALLDERITKVGETLSSLIRMDFLEGEAEKGREAQDRAKEHVTKLEKVIDLIKPKGKLRSVLIERGRQGEGVDLLAMINQVMEAARWGEVHLATTRRTALDPFLLVGKIADVLRSKSQRWMLNLAVQIALAKASGLGILAVDDADILDSDNRIAFSHAIGAAASAGMFTQTIICATKAVKEIVPVRGFKVHAVTMDSLGYATVVTHG